MEGNKARESLPGLMEVHIKESSMKITFMVKGLISGQMGEYI